MIKNGILIVKYYKKGELYSSQVLNPSQCLVQKQAVGQKSQTSGYWGLNLNFEPKTGWLMTVNGRKRVLSDGSKVTLSDKMTAQIELKPLAEIKLGKVEAEKIQKIQVVVLDSKNQYVFSDVLPNKKSQKFKFANIKVKINKPASESWEQIHKDDKGFKISVRQVFVASESEIKSPVPFSYEDKELIKKIAYGYLGAVAFFLISYAVIYLVQRYFADQTKYDVVKIDETMLQEKREKLLKEKKVVTPDTKKVAKVKTVKAYEKSKVIEKGAAKKAIAKKTDKKSSGGGPKNKKVAVEGVKSSKMKITQGRKGAKGNFGQADKNLSKLSKLSGLSAGIGFNSKSANTASNLSERGQGGDFSSLRKGSPTGSNKGFGMGGSGNGTQGMGSYKVGGLGTMSLGGSTRGGGTGASLSKNKTGRGYIDGIEEEVVVVGGLDRSVIERIIKRNMGDINYCYERRLNARPNLSGVFEAEFMIGANGSVQRSGSGRNTLGDDRLDSCINSSIKTWKFPKPVGGTVVKVNYPFILKSS
jgi:hypothetical protein